MPTIEQLEKLLTLDDQDTFVLYALAQEHAKAGDHPKAVEFYSRCLLIDEAYCYAYFHKARSLEADGLMQEAQETLEAGLAMAQRTGDGKAAGELQSYLAEIRIANTR